MRKLKLGLIGLGRVADHYENVLNQDSLKDSYEISVGVDQLEKARNNWKDKVQSYVTDDISNLVAEDIDLAIVLTPSGSHEEDSRKLIEKKINVLCEKPIGLNINNVKNNISLAEENGVQYGGVFQNRFNKPIAYLKDLIDKGTFGKIVSCSVRLQWCRLQEYYNDDWHGKWSLDGGVINQQAIHHIDTLFYLLGPPKKGLGFSGKVNNSLEAEDAFVASGQLNSGGFFTLEATTAIRPHDIKASIEIMGDKAQASIGGVALNKIDFLQVKGQEYSKKILKENSEEVDNGYGNGHIYLLESIAKKWKQDQNVCLPISASESLKAVKYIHAFYSSVEENKVVEFDSGVMSKRLGVRDV